jgi:osmotically-inducible protein OsmY
LNAAGTAASSGINTARVIQSMSETEMRVGMRSTEFGDISIRTMVSQQQMQTQISVDHSELSNAISAHIPAMQAKLDNQYGLHASIEVSQGGASFSGQREQSSQRDQRAFAPSVPLEGTAPAADMDRMVLRVPSVSVMSDRLDIRA